MSWGSVTLHSGLTTRRSEAAVFAWADLDISDDTRTSECAAALALPYDLFHEPAGSHPVESTDEVRVRASQTGWAGGIIRAPAYSPQSCTGELTERVAYR